MVVVVARFAVVIVAGYINHFLNNFERPEGFEPPLNAEGIELKKEEQ